MHAKKELDLDYMNDHAEEFEWNDKLWGILNAVNQKAYWLGLKTIDLKAYQQKAKNIQLKQLFKPVFNHYWGMVPRANKEQKKDAVITIYRRLRYWFNLTLPYNENWLNESQA